MNPKLAWGLIIAGGIIVLCLAIGGVCWALKKGKQEDLKKILDDAVQQGVHAGIDDVVSSNKNHFTTGADDKTSTVLTEIASLITIVTGDLDPAKQSLKDDGKDKVKVNAVDEAKATSKLSDAKTNIAKEIIEELTVEAIENTFEDEKVKENCQSEAVTATKEKIKDIVDNGTSDEEKSKNEVKELAEDAAKIKANAVLTAKWTTIETSVVKDAKDEIKEADTKLAIKKEAVRLAAGV